ncbi:MAG: SUMF1/EgtB/PvdO family nonheme iron enzyme [Candidatus Omnitrophota bacterium]
MSLTLKKISLVWFFVLSSVACAYANGITITNGQIIGQDTTANTVTIQFDISWYNSWRDSTNYDAAWIFIKYSSDVGVTWSHATLKTSGTNPSGFSVGSGTVIDIVVPADKKGCFIRHAASTGAAVTLSTTSIQIVWDYGTDGVSDANAWGVDTRINISGIEMVYVETGSFIAGDGNQPSGVSPSDYGFRQGSSPSGKSPWAILDEGAISVLSTAVGPYYYESAGNSGEDVSNSAFIIPAGFPKGYSAFYVMKHELSQGMYRDFLNTLTRTQQAARVVADISGDSIPNYYVMSNGTTVAARNGIRAPASGNGTTPPVVFGCDFNNNGTFNESGDGEWIPMNYIAWQDAAAFADWAALRSMTELEFEKAARGKDIIPTNLEYAWGDVTPTQSVGAITNPGQNSEVNSTASANMVYAAHANVPGPLRCGQFAAVGTSTRLATGGGYYGALDMSGNVRELVVTVGNATGRAYSGTHGNGALSSAGNADIADWPGYSSGENTAATGSGQRGGDWYAADTLSRISERTNAANASTRSSYIGARLARTAP